MNGGNESAGKKARHSAGRNNLIIITNSGPSTECTSTKRIRSPSKNGGESGFRRWKDPRAPTRNFMVPPENRIHRATRALTNLNELKGASRKDKGGPNRKSKDGKKIGTKCLDGLFH